MSNERITTPEKDIDCKNIVVIVEDSSACAHRHERNLSMGGIQVKIFRDLRQFSMFIAETKNAKKIKAVITDGLGGDWVGVVEAAKIKQIDNIWLISGNQEFINRGKNISGVTSISKGDLERRPETYQQIIRER